MNEQRIEIVGILTFDSLLDAAPDRRAAAGPEDRHLIYEGSGVILDLILKRAGTEMSIHVGGQILPQKRALDDVADVTVWIEHGKRRSSTQTNALGEFSFHAVPDDAFDLSIVLRDRRFSVHGLSRTEPRMWRVDSTAAVVRG